MTRALLVCVICACSVRFADAESPVADAESPTVDVEVIDYFHARDRFIDTRDRIDAILRRIWDQQEQSHRQLQSKGPKPTLKRKPGSLVEA